MADECEALFRCAEPVYYKATYNVDTADGCSWPQSRLFCREHGVTVAAEWLPPDDTGWCTDGDIHPLTFNGLERLT